MMSPRALLQTSVIAAVLASLAFAAAPLVWHLTGAVAIETPALNLQRVEAEPAPPVSLAPIHDLAPFGAPTRAPSTETADIDRPLDMVLRGVVIDPDPARSVAFVTLPEGTAKFRPGERIDARAVLTRVEPSRITLDVDGREEILFFPDAILPDAPESKAPTGLDRLSQAAITGPAGPTPPNKPAPRTTEDYLALWQERIRQNPGAVLDAIGLVPTENGYRIAEKHDSGVKSAGMQPGDLVTRVNGQAVGDVERDRKFAEEIVASGQARVEIERNGRTIVMTFPLR